MSCEIANSIALKCKDSLGGIGKIYLFPFVQYSRSQIILDNNVLTTFPSTSIFEFQSIAKPSVSESQSEQAGGKFYDQSISLTFGGNDFYELQKLISKDYRLIYLDNNGLYRILGLYNGVISNSLEYATGSSKSELNGVTMTFNGNEESGGIFIDNLVDAGFVIFGETFYRITQDGMIRITQDSNFRIIQ